MTDDALYDDARVDRVARGMLARYRTAAVAREMAHWHSMDYASHGVTPHAEAYAYWLRVYARILALSPDRDRL